MPNTTSAIRRRQRRSGAGSRGRSHSQPAMIAITAAKLIWKLAPSTAAGCSSSTRAAASAKPRMEIARRPVNSASVANAAMAKERCIGTPAPVSSM